MNREQTVKKAVQDFRRVIARAIAIQHLQAHRQQHAKQKPIAKATKSGVS